MNNQAILVIGTGQGSMGLALASMLRNERVVVITADINDTVLGSRYDQNHIQVNLLDPSSFDYFIAELQQMLVFHDAELMGFAYCAGINKMSPVGKLTAESFEDTMMINTIAPMLILGGIADRMSESVRAARVTGVFLGSNSAFVARTQSVAYCSSKAALAHAVKCAHRELAPRGFSLMTVDPGPVFGTRMDRAVREQLVKERGWNDHEYEEIILKNVPGHNPLFAEDVACLMSFLLFRGWGMGGQNVRMDHGQQQG